MAASRTSIGVLYTGVMTEIRGRVWRFVPGSVSGSVAASCCVRRYCLRSIRWRLPVSSDNSQSVIGASGVAALIMSVSSASARPVSRGSGRSGGRRRPDALNMADPISARSTISRSHSRGSSTWAAAWGVATIGSAKARAASK